MIKYAVCSCEQLVTYPGRQPLEERQFWLVAHGRVKPAKYLKSCHCNKQPCPKCGKTTHSPIDCPRNFGKLGLGAGKKWKPKKGETK